MTVAVAGADAARRRRRWPWTVLVVAVVLAALLVAAEAAARAVVPGIVRSAVVDELHLPADQQLDVQASGILLPQLMAGELEKLKLSSDRVTIGGITGSARATVTRIPIRGGALGSAKGTVAIDEKQFRALLESSSLPDAEITLRGPDASVHGAIPLLGREVPIGLTVTPSADDGDLLLTPVSVALGGREIDLQALAALLGDAGARLAEPQRICIADRLPAGMTLTGLRIEGDRAVADISADGRIAVDPALLEHGTCAH